uniref:CHCH domain-containing protein n=1 Tax=Quercus lobata TaxID=97700 RepID=A0A7N2R4I1_QUELO
MTSGAFGGNRGLSPVPPEKGIFPLDHMHLCDLAKKEYLSCLKSSGHTSEKCRHLSKKYLQCRMEKLLKAKISPPKPQLLLLSLALAALGNLMAKQDMSELGFGKESNMEAFGQKVNERIDNQS